MNKFESASILAGISPNEEEQALAPTNLHAITGEVVGQSDNGKVLISMDGMVFTGDDSQYVEMDTIGGLEEGDISTILLTGENGKAMRPLAIGSAGSIDRIRSTVESAETLAQQAEAVATATGQHFWTDNDGVHVTEVAQDEWSDSTSPSYHSGANVLLNALGQLFRNRLNNLLAVLTSGIAIYDGNGNDSANILAEFTANRIRLGKKSSSGESTYAKVEFFDGDSLLASSVIPDGGEGVEGGRNNILLTDIYKLGELKAYGYHGISNQVTNDGQNTKEQAYSSMQAMTSDNSVYSSVGALVLRNNGGTPSSKITMHADYVDLSDNDTIKSVKMKQAIAVLSSPVTLFTGTYAQTHSAAVTLSETAANFSRMLIEWETADGNQGSTMLSNPNGKRFEAVAINCSSTTYPTTYLKWKVFVVNGTTISNYNPSNGGFQRGEVVITNNASPKTTRNEYIGIIRVLGWR